MRPPDDDALVHAAIHPLTRSIEGIEFVTGASNDRKAVQPGKVQDPDVAARNIITPEWNGQVCRGLRCHHQDFFPGIPGILLWPAARVSLIIRQVGHEWSSLMTRA